MSDAWYLRLITHELLVSSLIDQTNLHLPPGGPQLTRLAVFWLLLYPFCSTAKKGGPGLTVLYTYVGGIFLHTRSKNPYYWPLSLIMVYTGEGNVAGWKNFGNFPIA